ncbi:uncharacterized protein V1477_009330 [Vespula maculifrons]|uniref:Centrosomal protein of 192 kDa n=1 Tax=Vespula maculifrons TaxID=7453 RepID=A0ABD2C9G2_VESMC
MSTPSKFHNTELEMTLLSTPMPKASSTVQRKSTFKNNLKELDMRKLEDKYLDRNFKNENFASSSLRGNNMLLKSDDSSLGILNNISTLLGETSGVNDKQKRESDGLNAEQELARKLLRKCSNFKGLTFSSDANKKDDVNIETLTKYFNPSDHDGNSSTYNNENKLKQQNSTQTLCVEGASNSVVFEPKEITARSSEMSKSAEKNVSSFSPKSTGGISFDATTAELMELFNNEEFQSVSQMTNHLLADESSWKQNCSYDLPLATSSEKEYLDLSCFSGIIGELDLSVESNAGRKVSIGEFFKRKCGNIGDLSNDIVERPTLGLSINSPKKKNRLIPLVDSTIADGSLTFREKEQTHLTNSTKDIEEQSIMSLSSIAQALQEIDNCTPRRLVDQLIMAKKKRKEFQLEKNDDKGNTYTLLPSSRCSMPATPSALNIKDDNKSSKLSLDSKTINKTLENKATLPRMLSFTSDLDLHTKDTLENIPQRKSLKKEETEKSSTSLQQQDEIKLSDIQSIFKDNKFSLPEMKSNKSGMERKESFKQENISYTSKMDYSVAQKLTTTGQSNLETMSQLHDIIVSRNSQEICSCIVGISREADIALTNTSDRWIICSLGTFQLQGNKQNIILHLPKDTILIKPNSTQSVKIGVKITKKSNPAIVILNIITTDMVTRKESIIKHMIYVESEELQVNVLTPFKKAELNFGNIIENTMETLSITLQNKNNMVLPIILSIVHDGPKVFNINNLQDGFTHELKPREQFTAVVQCEGVSSLLASESLKNQLISIEAKLLIQVDNKKDDAVMIKEVPLYVKIGSCKIQVVDTELPIEIPRKQTKSLNIVNTGELPLSITAFIVQDEKSSNRIEDFSVKPETLILKRNATDRFLITFKPRCSDTHDRHVKIKLSIGNNTYYYSVIGQQNVEAENESYLRCETPQQTSDAVSPSSPHSMLSSRSGRNSPISSISGSTVAGDKIPIKSTHAALVWGSVKPSKSDTKEFTIRNISDNRIKLQVQISDKNNSFLFLKDHQTISPNIVLVLHRMESRTLSVVFCPRHVGAATGKIIFKHYEIKKEENKSRPSKAILLYGYGGFGRVIISEIFKDINGKMWLPLGKLNSGEILNAKIKLENIGDLYSYAKVKLIPKAIYPSMVSSWQVNPTELLLEPKETQWVTLEFQPRKEDLILLRQRSDVCHVGTINIIYGDEPTRWRIRDLNGGESEPFRNIVYPLCKVFPGEQLMPDLNLINDTIQNLSDLCHGVRQHEIILTVETNADETLSMIHDSADESQMFYSLYSDNSHVDVESSGKSFLPSETIIGGCEVNVRHELFDDYFTVSPNVVNLIPSIKNEAIITILSSSRVAQPYETVLSNTDVLSIVPAEGMIPAGKGFPLKIKCKQKVQRNLEATLEIYTENHRQDVKIKVAVVQQ